MIKIIAGKFGLQTTSGIVIKNTSSEPFQASAKTEARLVKNGIAKYVDDDKISSQKIETQGNKDDEQSSVTPNELPEYNNAMKLATLKEIAIMYGVDAKSCTSKNAVVALIDAKVEESEEESEDEPEDETPLELSTVDSVV